MEPAKGLHDAQMKASLSLQTRAAARRRAARRMENGVELGRRTAEASQKLQKSAAHPQTQSLIYR